MKIYVAAPLFNEMELKRNEEIAKLLEDLGFDTYLPQRDAGKVAELLDNAATPEEGRAIEKRIFNMDIDAMNSSDMLLFLMDGFALDEGSVYELGYMQAQGKLCVGYMTDRRDLTRNLMIRESFKEIFKSKDELKEYFSKLIG